MNQTTPGYAVGYLQDIDLNESILDYIARIDRTLEPFEGRFIVHGGALTALEGTWDGDLVVITFPDTSAAQAWYDSPGYQEILPLRTDNARSIVCLAEGVPAGYRAAHSLARLSEQAG